MFLRESMRPAALLLSVRSWPHSYENDAVRFAFISFLLRFLEISTAEDQRQTAFPIDIRLPSRGSGFSNLPRRVEGGVSGAQGEKRRRVDGPGRRQGFSICLRGLLLLPLGRPTRVWAPPGNGVTSWRE
jgi:hypothetical protein